MAKPAAQRQWPGVGEGLYMAMSMEDHLSLQHGMAMWCMAVCCRPPGHLSAAFWEAAGLGEPICLQPLQSDVNHAADHSCGACAGAC